jgi:predicted lipid-binding transport protein (Tim44 family)
MSDGFAYLDIIFFAMVAAFVAYRLRSVLGRKTGNERPRVDPISRRTASGGPDNVVPLPDRGKAAPAGADTPTPPADTPAVSGVADIRRADPKFDVEQFLQGARAAFAMIVEAFAKGDKGALRPLLADEVFAQFAGAIDAREQAGRARSTELVATRAADLVDAGMVGSRARVTVRFTSEQINLTRDAAGEVVEGDPRQIDTVIDTWTFERDTRSRDPNWQLVETGAAG